MKTATLQQLRDRVAQRADQVNDLLVSSAELDGYINQVASELYDLLRTSYGSERYASTTPTTISVTAGTGSYSLPSDFLELRMVSAQVGSEWVKLNEVPLEMANARSTESVDGPAFGYRLFLPNNIDFLPTPAESTTVRMHYVPAYTEMTGSGDTFDGVNGWEEYIVLGAAIKCLVKEESDPSALIMEQDRLRARIVRLASEQDSSGIEVMRDVQGDMFRRGRFWSRRLR